MAAATLKAIAAILVCLYVTPSPLRHTRAGGCLSQVPLIKDARLHGHDGKKRCSFAQA